MHHGLGFRVKVHSDTTRGLRAGMSAGLKKFMWVAKTQQTTLPYKASTCADCICSEQACLLQPLLASGICYYSQAAIYPFPHSTHGPVNWQGLPSGYLSVLCRPNTESLCLRAFLFLKNELCSKSSFYVCRPPNCSRTFRPILIIYPMTAGTLSQRVHIHYQYGIRIQKTILIVVWGSNSIIVVFLGP